MRALFVFVFAFLGAFVGCGADFDPGSRVLDFRLLAVAADKPFAVPGETVRLTTLHHEPFGRPITWAWATCPLPRDSTVNACLARLLELARAGAAPPFTIGPTPAFDAVIPANVLDGVPQEARANALVGVVTVACPGSLTLKDLAGIGPGELPFSCADANTREILPYERYAVSVKRIYLYSKDRNQNPAITGVTWDGALWPEAEVREANACDFDSNAFSDCTGEKHTLVVSTPPGTAELGTSEYGTPFHEDLVIQHYATEGAFEFDVKTVDVPKTQWAARKRARGQTVQMWFVVRDSRGGVTWTTRRVQVR